MIDDELDVDSPIYVGIDGIYYEAMPAINEDRRDSFVAYFDKNIEEFDIIYQKDGKLLRATKKI